MGQGNDVYGDLVQAFRAVPRDEWNRKGGLGDAFMHMVTVGLPGSRVFIERLALDVCSPVVEEKPPPGPGMLEEAIDAIPKDEFLALALVFLEMSENRPEVDGAFLRALGPLFGESITRRNE